MYFKYILVYRFFTRVLNFPCIINIHTCSFSDYLCGQKSQRRGRVLLSLSQDGKLSSRPGHFLRVSERLLEGCRLVDVIFRNSAHLLIRLLYKMNDIFFSISALWLLVWSCERLDRPCTEFSELFLHHIWRNVAGKQNQFNTLSLALVQIF